MVRELVSSHRLRVIVIITFELGVGTDLLARRDDILQLVRSRTHPLDPASAFRAGEVAATLRAAGQDTGMADCLQAGICLNFDLTFATRNRKHFDRVEGLRLLDVAAR